MTKKYGTCALCKKECELTFEHIPPRGALNDIPQKSITGDSIMDLITDSNRYPWETEGIKYLNQQKGTGMYSLCAECNNNTGSWYAEEYIKFAVVTHYILMRHKNEISPGLYMLFNDVELYPLRFFKQIISMFASVNHAWKNNLGEFVLDKETQQFDISKYKVFMYLVEKPTYRVCPFSVMMYLTDIGMQNTVVSEITCYPFGFVLVELPDVLKNKNLLDITDFCNYEYNEKVVLEMRLPILEVNGTFPLDYRSRDEIIACIEKNRKDQSTI